MRRVLLLTALFLMACPGDPGGTGGGTGSGGTISGRLTIFQGAKSAPRLPTLASMVPNRRPRALLRPLPVGVIGAQTLSLAVPPPAAAPRPALPEWIAGEVIVRFEEKLTTRQALRLVQRRDLVTRHGGFGSEYLHLLRLSRLDGTPLSVGETREAAARLKTIPGVRFTEVNQWQHAFAVPNDKLYSAQWHYAALNLPAAWDITKGSATVVVAVIDTGIVPHPDLDAKVLPGFDAISDSTNAGDGDGRDSNPLDMGGDLPNNGSSWHGSHTAGTVGAATNNTIGVAGVDWNARLLPVRVLGKQGGSLLDIAAGMTWATGGTVPGSPANPTKAKVVSMSLGGTAEGASDTYQDVINTATAGGAIFVIAAGNSNEDAFKTIPCIQQSVICVGATRFSGKRASYSNFGAAVTVMAPGGETAEDANGDGEPDGVLSTQRDAAGQPSLAFSQGTSMACPHVAGVVALMVSVNPALTFATAKTHLTTTANNAQQCSEGCGAGMVNAHAAVLAAKGQPPSGPAKLAVGASDLFFSAATPTVSLGVSNLGATALNLTASVAGTAASALSFPKGSTLTLGAGQSGSMEVTASLTGLADGVHPANLVISSNGGEATVSVKVRAGAGGSGKPAEVGLAYLDTDGTTWKVAATASATAASGYTYSITAPPGTYYVVGLIDENANDQLEDTEPVGLYPTYDSPEAVEVTEGSVTSNVDFPLGPHKAITDSSSGGIGDACTTTCPGDGVCVTAWPGGYCSKDCSTASCPLGSSCVGESPPFCVSSCTGPGAGQSSCRTSYVCYDDGTGKGVCLPRCAVAADCGTTTVCNTTTGYCE